MDTFVFIFISLLTVAGIIWLLCEHYLEKWEFRHRLKDMQADLWSIHFYAANNADNQRKERSSFTGNLKDDMLKVEEMVSKVLSEFTQQHPNTRVNSLSVKYDSVRIPNLDGQLVEYIDNVKLSVSQSKPQ